MLDFDALSTRFGKIINKALALCEQQQSQAYRQERSDSGAPLGVGGVGRYVKIRRIPEKSPGTNPSCLSISMTIGEYGGCMPMEIVRPLLIAVVIVTAVAFVWRKTAGRFSGYINGMISVFLFSALAYVVVSAIVAVVFRGATSVDEIIAMLF